MIKTRDISKSVDPDGTIHTPRYVSPKITDPVKRWLVMADYLDHKINAEGNPSGSNVNPFSDDLLVLSRVSPKVNPTSEYDYFPVTRSNFTSSEAVPIGYQAARISSVAIQFSSPSGSIFIRH